MDGVAKIQAEFDRVGVSYAKAGAAKYIVIMDEVKERVTFLGPPRFPRLTWRGSVSEALRRLEGLEDNAGVEVFWTAFASGDR